MNLLIYTFQFIYTTIIGAPIYNFYHYRLQYRLPGTSVSRITHEYKVIKTLKVVNMHDVWLYYCVPHTNT